MPRNQYGTKFGRPTKYDDDMPRRVYESLAAGRSITEWAASEGIDVAKVYDWEKAYPAFREGLSLGRQASQAHWEGELKKMMYMRNVNSPLVKLYFANRFGWHDRPPERPQEDEEVETVDPVFDVQEARGEVQVTKGGDSE